MTTTTTATRIGDKIHITPAPIWQPLPIEGDIPPPYTTSKFGYEVVPLHPTFGCELKGVDWSKPISPEQYAEIRALQDKVRYFATKGTSAN